MDQDSYVAGILNRTKASSYEEMVAARRKRNEERLRQSGLLEVVGEFKRTRNQSQKQVTPVKRESTVQIKRRSSKRVAGKPAIYSPPLKDERPQKIQKRRLAGRSQRNTHSQEQLSLWTLKTEQSWIEDMHKFLLSVPHGRQDKVVSSANARNVMAQVSKLASGQGVTYHAWPSNVVFAKNRPITLNSDLEALYEEAVEYERRHGKDKGNGWLLRHPIIKMQNYQAYLLDKQHE